MGNFRIISSDDHVFEPADLWTSRMESQFTGRAPRVVRHDDGSDWWYCDGKKVQSTGIGAQAGRRFDDPGSLSVHDTFDNVRPGGYIPEEHVKDMEIDSVDVSVIYPTVGLQLYSVPDGALVTEVFKTYNDWIAEFCRPFPKVLKGIGMLNVDDIESAIGEMERCADLGLVGAMITVYPPEEMGYYRPEYEPLWAAAQDLRMPLSLHVSTNRAGAGLISDVGEILPASLCVLDYWIKLSLAHMIFGGVFERYPKLQVGSVEMELSWAPHFMERMDILYTQRPKERSPYRFKGDMLPSDFFRRNVFLGFQEDALGIQLRHVIGVDSLLWGSDYPHFEGTFPRSRQILEEILVDCAEEEKASIAGGNTARVYGLA